MTQLIAETAIETVTQSLAPFIAKSRESNLVNEFDSIHFLQSMRDGMLKAGELVSQAQYQHSRTKAALERLEAHLRMDVFPEYAQKRGIIKSTEKDKEAFILLQPQHEKLTDELNQWAAVLKYTETVRSMFYTASDDVKKTLYSKSHYNNISITS